MFAVDVRCKIIDVIMIEPERICIQGAKKFLVRYNSEKEVLRYRSQKGVIYGQ